MIMLNYNSLTEESMVSLVETVLVNLVYFMPLPEVTTKSLNICKSFLSNKKWLVITRVPFNRFLKPILKENNFSRNKKKWLTAPIVTMICLLISTRDSKTSMPTLLNHVLPLFWVVSVSVTK